LVSALEAFTDNHNLKIKSSKHFYLQIFEQIRFRKQIITKKHREGYGNESSYKNINLWFWV